MTSFSEVRFWGPPKRREETEKRRRGDGWLAVKGTRPSLRGAVWYYRMAADQALDTNPGLTPSGSTAPLLACARSNRCGKLSLRDGTFFMVSSRGCVSSPLWASNKRSCSPPKRGFDFRRCVSDPLRISSNHFPENQREVVRYFRMAADHASTNLVCRHSIGSHETRVFPT
jgi:hypothetical protein